MTEIMKEEVGAEQLRVARSEAISVLTCDWMLSKTKQSKILICCYGNIR